MNMASGKHRHTSEEFPHLSRAPIAEAVIHWQAPAGQTVDEEKLLSELRERFPAFECQAQHEIQAELKVSREGVEPTHLSRWDGFRLIGRDDFDKYVVQFKPNGVVFSRLAPYNSWQEFLNASLPFWDLFVNLQRPPMIDRLGVRFINKISLNREGMASAYIKEICKPPKGFEFIQERFLHQDRFRLPDSPYEVNWVRTVQPSTASDKVLIVDIDVSTERLLPDDRKELLKRLGDMRSIKNKLFFSRLTSRALKQFGGSR